MLSKAILSSYHNLIEFVLWICVIAGGAIGASVGNAKGGIVGLFIFGGIGILVTYLTLAIFAGAALLLLDIRQSLLRIEKTLEKQP